MPIAEKGTCAKGKKKPQRAAAGACQIGGVLNDPAPLTGGQRKAAKKELEARLKRSMCMKTKKLVKKLQRTSAGLGTFLNDPFPMSDDMAQDTQKTLTLAAKKLKDQRKEIKRLKKENKKSQRILDEKLQQTLEQIQ